MNLRRSIPALAFLLLAPLSLTAQTAGTIPHLEKHGDVTQLMVDGKPYVMLAGELFNSSSSSLAYMQPEWAKLSAMGLNTVFTPVSWELVEPTEGHYDFTLVDGLLAQAREQHMHIVFLWLAAWKNGMSSYPPVWVKQDTERFPRVMEDGNPQPILSTFAPALVQADSAAFKALMEHLAKVDATDHTVLMMQVENEVGVLGAARDHSAVADKAFAGDVPEDLMHYLVTHRTSLNPELRALWVANGAKTHGTWTDVFGDTERADEIFMAWHYAKYVQAVAAAGKLPIRCLCMQTRGWAAKTRRRATTRAAVRSRAYLMYGRPPVTPSMVDSIWSRPICTPQALQAGAIATIGLITRF
jgi:beta-galactosidase GanA